MKCETARLHLAREQSPTSVMSEEFLAAREHYELCDACRAALATQWNLARRIRAAGEGTVAPPDLRARILAALDSEPVTSRGTGSPRRRTSARWFGATAAIAAAAIVLYVVAQPNQVPLGAQLVSVVEAAPATDSTMASSDFGELAEWLESKLGYPVHVPPITGAVPTAARVAKVGSVATVAISYELPGGSLTYFALPTEAGTAVPDRVETLAADGYHVATWAEYGAPRAVVARLPRDRVQAIAEECKHMAVNPAAL